MDKSKTSIGRIRPLRAKCIKWPESTAEIGFRVDEEACSDELAVVAEGFHHPNDQDEVILLIDAVDDGRPRSLTRRSELII